MLKKKYKRERKLVRGTHWG